MANKFTNYVQNHKAEIKQKALVLGGATIGLVIASGVVEKLTKPRVTNVIVVNELPEEVVDPSSEPLEP